MWLEQYRKFYGIILPYVRVKQHVHYFTLYHQLSVDDMKSMAVESVLLLQEKINDNDDRDTVNFRLLVPSKVIGCVIGKSGVIINDIRKRTKADVRISKDKKPKCARDDDELVEVGDNGYGSYSSKAFARMLPPSTVEVSIPANVAGKVLGRGGGNIDNIRKENLSWCAPSTSDCDIL